MRILVAMSGGVDSASAAHALREAGHEVIGLTLRLWRSSRLSEDYIERAGRLCRALGIAHRVADRRQIFECAVVDRFCAEYVSGRTPNPCVLCNRCVKMTALLDEAQAVRAHRVATGHYARVVRCADGRFELRRAADRRKDQSYVLYRLGQRHLRRLVLPLGERRKADVRRAARAFWPWPELPAESQEVCFLPPGGYAAFIRRRLRERPDAAGLLRPGRVVDTAGRVLGRHRGVYNFTVGQRRRLGVAAGRPLYVVRIETETATVVVGDRRDTLCTAFRVSDVTWCRDVSPFEGGERGGAIRAEVKIRYAHRAAPATLEPVGAKVRVAFDEAQHAVTPGQSAVFYRGEAVLGGGIIEGAPDIERGEQP